MRSRYVGRRLLQLALVLFVAGTINFIIPRLLPGDPVATAVARMQAGGGSNAINAEELSKVWNAKFGLDQPLWNQYVNYWTDLFKGDLGTSVLQLSASRSRRRSASPSCGRWGC